MHDIFFCTSFYCNIKKTAVDTLAKLNRCYDAADGDIMFKNYLLIYFIVVTLSFVVVTVIIFMVIRHGSETWPWRFD